MVAVSMEPSQRQITGPQSSFIEIGELLPVWNRLLDSEGII